VTDSTVLWQPHAHPHQPQKESPKPDLSVLWQRAPSTDRPAPAPPAGPGQRGGTRPSGGSARWSPAQRLAVLSAAAAISLLAAAAAAAPLPLGPAPGLQVAWADSTVDGVYPPEAKPVSPGAPAPIGTPPPDSKP
jgi:hypothetical protein